MNIKWILAISFIIFFIAEITSQFTFNVIGDDQVYYYMGKLVAEGFTPYLDFFYAHPPLQLILYGFILKFIPYSFHTFKVFFILLTIFNAYLLFLLAKREFGDKVAVLASIMALFAPTTLFNASFEYGLTIGLTLFLSALLVKNKALQLILFELCVFYRFHFIFLILGYYAYEFVRFKSWKHCALFLILFLVINGLLAIISTNYYTDTIYYHLHKPKDNLDSFIVWSTIIKMNFVLFLAPLSLLMLYPRKIKGVLKYLMIPLPFLLFMLKGTFFGYYFMVVVPFLAAISSYFLFSVGKKGIIIGVLAFAIGIISVIGIFNYQGAYAQPIELNIPKDRVITGDPPMVSYISLAQGNPVLNNDVDNNNMIYEEGIKNISRYIEEIRTHNSLVIIKPDEGLYVRIKEFKEFIDNCTLLNSKKEYLIKVCP